MNLCQKMIHPNFLQVLIFQNDKNLDYLKNHNFFLVDFINKISKMYFNFGQKDPFYNTVLPFQDTNVKSVMVTKKYT